MLFNSYSFHSFPLYGYYYCWVLGKVFDVILLVEKGNEESPAVQALLKHKRVAKIVLMPPRYLHEKIHFWAAKKMLNILRKYKPVAVFQANFQYYHQKYIFNAVRRYFPGVPCIVFQGTQILANTTWFDSYYELKEARINTLAARFPCLPFMFVRWGHGLRGYYLHFRDYWLYPLVLNGKRLRQTYDPYSGKLDRDVSDQFDVILTYSDYERQAYRMEVSDISRIHVIEHPMQSDFNATLALYPGVEQSNSIAVLPSRCVQYGGKAKPECEIARVGELWRGALVAIRESTGAQRVLWKLHPDFSGEPIMEGVTRYLARELPGFEVLPTNASPQLMILSSKFVVGDVSSTLLWAARLGGRIVYSLNIFGVEGGDEMGSYEGIFQINDARQLKSTINPAGGKKESILLVDVVSFLERALKTSAKDNI